MAAVIPDDPTPADFEHHARDLEGLRMTCGFITAIMVGAGRPSVVDVIAQSVREVTDLPEDIRANFTAASNTQESCALARGLAIALVDASLVSIAFDNCKAFCNRGGRKHEFFKRMKLQPWYTFARIVRNALNHNYVLRDLPPTPIVWEGVTFTPNMEGAVLQRREFLTNKVARSLVDAMIVSARAGYLVPSSPSPTTT